MKFSIFQMLMLAAFGALAVAGIIIFAIGASGAQSGATVGNVTIWGTLDKSAFDTALSQIIQQDQSLSGVSYVQKNAATFNQSLANAIAEQKGPDLYVISSDDAMVNANRVFPIPYTSITQQQFKDVFVSAANPFLGAKGVIALPFVVDPLVLYWNRDLLAGAGIAQPPTLWDQVPAMVQTMTVKDTTGSVQKSGIAFGTYSNVEDAKAIVSMLVMQAANVGRSVANPITGFDPQGNFISALNNAYGASSPPAIDALGFYTEFANPAQTDYSWNGSFTSARTSFAQGQVALYVGFASENSLIGSTNPNLSYSEQFVPQLAHSSRLITFGRAYGFAIPLNSKNPSGALLAAEKLDTASTTVAFANALGMASAKRLSLSGQTGDQQLVNQAALAAWNWSDPDPSATGVIFQAMIDSVGSGAKTLTDAVSLADQQLLHTIGQ